MATDLHTAAKLALEALEGLEALLLSMGLTHLIVYGDAEKAITNLQKALANEALDKMAENARELGLDYDVKSDHRLMEQPAQQCNHCNGSGRMVRDQDIGTDQECFVCEGSGTVEPEQPAQEPVPVKDNTYGYAKSLAEAIFKQHFASDEHYASGRIVWGVNDTVIGILTQIDNMVADMVRRPAQQEPHGWYIADYGAVVGSLEPTHRKGEWKPFYTRPQAREPLLREIAALSANALDDYKLIQKLMAERERTWVGLTDEEKRQLFDREDYQGWLDYINAIEAKLKEKNA